jgi:crotonobetainyl-CoA:carnitine CoA-transferase CaiB-like acyl-CoA transferase
MVQTAVHETIGDMQLLGPVAKLSLTPAKINSAPPPLGHHTNDILQNKLGMSAAEIEILKVNGVI